MAFTKWISIENSYNSKFIKRFRETYFNELKEEVFIVTEKIDGSNFSITFYPDGHYEFSKRSGIIDSTDKFYNYKAILKDETVSNFIDNMQNYCQIYKKTFQFVGELFGQGVQKRVNYGSGRYWRWFGIYEHEIEYSINYNEIDIEEFSSRIMSLRNFDIKPFRVPILDRIIGLDKALEFNIMTNSMFTPFDYQKENLMEGVVIRPYRNYYIGEFNKLIVKKKNPSFDDRSVPKEKKKFNITENLQSLLEKTEGYVNENRTADLFSKNGPIEDIRQLGKYIGLYSKDIFEDIRKTYPLDFDNLEKKDRNWLMKTFVPKIKEELIKEL